MISAPMGVRDAGFSTNGHLQPEDQFILHSVVVAPCRPPTNCPSCQEPQQNRTNSPVITSATSATKDGQCSLPDAHHVLRTISGLEGSGRRIFTRGHGRECCNQGQGCGDLQGILPEENMSGIASEKRAMTARAYPTASAGATLCAARLRGKLKGDTMDTTPTGKRRVMDRIPVHRAFISMGAYSPACHMHVGQEPAPVST
jgi:hypothetical protein